MSDEREDGGLERLKRLYHPPGEAPVEEMWQAIAAELRSDGAAATADEPPGRAGANASDVERFERTPHPDVVDLDGLRAARARKTGRPIGWAVAAAAVLAMGVGIARMSVPGPAGLGGTPAGQIASAAGEVGGAVARGSAPTSEAPSSALAFAARQHLGRAEDLLTMVRADARAGRLDPALGASARGLLSQTRLLMDARGSGDPELDRLLEDLELVLAQVAGVAVAERTDDERARTELELTVSGMDAGEVLPRIRAALPMGLEAM
jgi:hypothetical protein